MVLRIPNLFFYSTKHLSKISAAVGNFRLPSKISTAVENVHMHVRRSKNVSFWVLRIPSLIFYSTKHLLKISAAAVNFRLPSKFLISSGLRMEIFDFRGNFRHSCGNFRRQPEIFAAAEIFNRCVVE